MYSYFGTFMVHVPEFITTIHYNTMVIHADKPFVLELKVTQDLAFQVPSIQYRLLLRLHSVTQIELF